MSKLNGRLAKLERLIVPAPDAGPQLSAVDRARIICKLLRRALDGFGEHGTDRSMVRRWFDMTPAEFLEIARQAEPDLAEFEAALAAGGDEAMRAAQRLSPGRPRP